MRILTCRPLSRDAFAPFGIVIDPTGATAEMINAATTRRYSDLARLDLRGPLADPVLSMYEANARTFPLRLLRMERHVQASQVFLPLGMQRFIVVVAPGSSAPDWARVVCFLTSPGQGIALHRGCWHHGLIALGTGHRFAVLEGGDYRNDTQEIDAPEAMALAAPDAAAAP